MAALIVPPCATAIDVPAGLFGVDALDRAADAVIEIHETLAAGRGLVDRGKPVAAGGRLARKRGAIHALPFAEMLLGKRCFVRHHAGFGNPAAQIASAV